MQQILLSILLLLILVFADIRPIVKEHDKKALCFAIPSYAVFLVISILGGLDVKLISINDMIKQLIKIVFKID